MSRSKATISDVLRRTIRESKKPLLVIERETGVARGSVMRFVRGDQSLRLDIADKLAAYFGLKVSAAKGRKAR
jgi:plasmid maintenance system antidote protein VapI